MANAANASEAKKKTAKKRGSKPLIRWQKPMVGVLIALVPCTLSAIHFFGWRTIPVILACVIPAFVAEYLFTRSRKEPVSSAVFVTAVLLALILPPTIPYGIAGVGAIVSIVFAKEVFGGFGRNVFNPALTGRCFLYICFPNALSGRDVWKGPVAEGTGFTKWLAAAVEVDGVTHATPLAALREAAGPATVERTAQVSTHLELFLGDRAGCLGETFVIAILLGALYLLYKRYADWRLMLSCVAGLLATTLLLWIADVEGVPDPLWNLLAGGFLFAAVFMITDPVSAARRTPSKWIYGAMVGVLTVLFRRWGGFPEGVMFAIIFMNIFNPTLDLVFAKEPRRRKQREESKREEKKEEIERSREATT
jgi:Na+-transporting NADH:ubiquinone oxidoreductase subunit B